MNGEQFKSLICQKYHINTFFWAPESAVYKFSLTKIYNEQDLYQQAIIVLCENENSFKNRVNGNIKDEWLSTKTFKPILKELILILETLYLMNDPKYDSHEYLKMQDWQIELLKIFKSF